MLNRLNQRIKSCRQYICRSNCSSPNDMLLYFMS